MIPCSTSPEGGCCGQDYEELSSILSSFPLVRALASTFLETTPTVPVCDMAFLVVSWNTCRAEPCRNFSVQRGVMVLDNGSRTMVPVEPGCFLSRSTRTEVTLQP